MWWLGNTNLNCHMENFDMFYVNIKLNNIRKTIRKGKKNKVLQYFKHQYQVEIINYF